jgi:hypothetical protein
MNESEKPPLLLAVLAGSDCLSRTRTSLARFQASGSQIAWAICQISFARNILAVAQALCNVHVPHDSCLGKIMME